MTGSSTTLSIGELAERSGVTVRARCHRDIGLLEPAHRTASGHAALVRLGLRDLAGALVDEANGSRIRGWITPP